MIFQHESVFMKAKQRQAVLFYSTFCVLLFCMLSKTRVLACDKVYRLTAENGRLLSEEELMSATTCGWEIQVAKGYRIELTVRVFEIETSCCSCVEDYVEFRDGLNLTSPLIGRYCANNKPSKVYSSQNALRVQFVSSHRPLRANRTRVNKFLAFYRTICGEFLHRSFGEISSPSYTNLTRINRCLFTIVVPYGWVKVTFTEFNLGTRSNNCGMDFITFKETAFVEFKGTTRAPKRLCGELKSFYIFSKGRELSLLYQTSQLFKSKFEAKFMVTNTSVAPCGGLFTNDAGYIYSYNYPKSYPRNTECVWKIEVPYGYIRLEFLQLNFVQCLNGKVEVYEGWSNNSVKISPDCRKLTKQSMFQSRTNRLLIKISFKHKNLGTFILSYKLVQQGLCLQGEFCCTNHKCINEGAVCDGVEDCSDGSDEFNCPQVKPSKALHILWALIIFIAAALVVICLWKTWRKAVHRTRRNQRVEYHEDDDYAFEVPSQSGAPPSYSEALNHTPTGLPSYEEALLNDNGGVVLEQGNTNSNTVRFHAHSDSQSRRSLPRRGLQRACGRPGNNTRQSELAVL